jgi:epoxyqueuosine reductase
MNKIKEILNRHNILKWGVVNDPLAHSYEHYKKWLERGDHGVLKYLEGERGEKRESISNYYEDFQSALVIAYDYSRTSKIANHYYDSEESNGLRIANYVMGFKGRDYHFELREKLEALAKDFQTLYPDVEIKHSLDTQPVLERDLAMRAGLGWFGKNSMIINKEIGSYFILGALFFSRDISEDVDESPMVETDHCGNCTKCIDLCPTNAIDIESRTLIADKCISTFSIELFKDAPAPEGMENGRGEIYGCDICQDVCPWNKRVIRQSDEVSEDELNDFKERNRILFDLFLTDSLEVIIEKLEAMSNREYRRVTKDTPVARTGRVGMLKNLKFYLNK